jgi:hypothetical protein
MRLPCENDQAKLDHFSRLACSTNLSKILKVDPPKRGLWIEARTVTSGCPRTCCAWLSATHRSGLGRFCANLLNLSNFHLSVKLNLFLRFRTTQPLAIRRSLHSGPYCEIQISRRWNLVFSDAFVRSLALRKISKIDQRNIHLSH